jgi:large subunit ribosomal protein L15
MTTNHRKKGSRHRGSWTHSHGEKKKHRGAGSRGGRGNAGSGKRGDAKKPSFWKIANREGGSGFKNPTTKAVKVITIAQLNQFVAKSVASGKLQANEKGYSIDLGALGFDKLLATGNPAYAFTITVDKATPKAVEKIEGSKGSVSLAN